MYVEFFFWVVGIMDVMFLEGKYFMVWIDLSDLLLFEYEGGE